MKRIALKRLSVSDLTFFETHYVGQGKASKQKAINLNADILVGRFYPTLALEATRLGERIPLALDIFGPSGAPGINLQRKITKPLGAKNWRLNGELIRDEPERFSHLHLGDFALIEFEGDAYPIAARMVLVAATLPADVAVHKGFHDFLGERSMAEISSRQLETLLKAGGIPDVHPLYGVNLEGDLEDAAQNGLEATRRLLKKVKTRRVSKAELKAARNQADETGIAGEEFVNEYLDQQRRDKVIASYDWPARENAVSPFDFSVTGNNGATERIDAKATVGPFKNPVHVSVNELLFMAEESVPYRIYRVYEVSDGRAKLRVSSPLGPVAKAIIPTLEALPHGVTADGVSIDPSTLTFGQEIELRLTNPADELE